MAMAFCSERNPTDMSTINEQLACTVPCSGGRDPGLLCQAEQPCIYGQLAVVDSDPSPLAQHQRRVFSLSRRRSRVHAAITGVENVVQIVYQVLRVGTSVGASPVVVEVCTDNAFR